MDRLSIERTVVLIEDYQREILARFTTDPARVLEQAASVLNSARGVGMRVVHVVVRYRPGHPELPPDHSARVEGRLVEGTEGAEIHPMVSPHPGELVLTKRRVGPFSTTELDPLLHAWDVDTLVVLGITTGGCVLSTVRWAADLGYRIVVVSDACEDLDPEVHRVLVEKVFPRQATVMTSTALAAALRHVTADEVRAV